MSNELVTLPPNVASRGVTLAQWNTLCDSLFPGAKTDSVLMVLDYCKSRGLDPMKKPCHIVPMRTKVGDEWRWRDVVMPGIYEYRMTAHGTGLYLGHSEPEYGPKIKFAGVEAPEWCRMVIYRWHELSKSKVEYPSFILFREVVATRWDKDAKAHVANDRWSRSPTQMLTKCCEAAGLRDAFPGELGGTHTEDEMYGKVIEATPQPDFGAGSADPFGAAKRVTVDAEWNEQRKAAEGEQVHEERKRRGKPATREPVRATEKNGGVSHDDPPPAEPSGNVASSGASAATDRTTALEASPDNAQHGSDEAPDTIIKSQQVLLEHRLKAKGIPVNEFCATFEINTLDQLPFDSMQEAKDWIEKQ